LPYGLINSGAPVETHFILLIILQIDRPNGTSRRGAAIFE